MNLRGKRVGRVKSRAGGSSTETVEIFGPQTGSGATNVNAASMMLQGMQSNEMIVAGDGSRRERSVLRARDIGGSSKMVQREIPEKVATPREKR